MAAVVDEFAAAAPVLVVYFPGHYRLHRKHIRSLLVMEVLAQHLPSLIPMEAQVPFLRFNALAAVLVQGPTLQPLAGVVVVVGRLTPSGQAHLARLAKAAREETAEREILELQQAGAVEQAVKVKTLFPTQKVDQVAMGFSRQLPAPHFITPEAVAACQVTP